MHPRIVYLKPGEAILRMCNCMTITGGILVDNPKCEMHHGEPTIYLTAP